MHAEHMIPLRTKALHGAERKLARMRDLSARYFGERDDTPREDGAKARAIRAQEMEIERLQKKIAKAGPGKLVPMDGASTPAAHLVPAFTLMEMLLVLGIAVLLASLGAYSVNRMIEANRTEAGLSTVQAALNSTRAQLGEGDSFGDYQGIALLFTPADLRIVRHVNADEDGSPLMEDSSTELPRQFSAYQDVQDVDYMQMPKGSGVVGIARSGDSDVDGLALLTPPFAMRFDANGRMVGPKPLASGELVASDRTEADGVNPVMYDGDYDGGYEWDLVREDGYSPIPFIPGTDGYERTPTVYDADANKPVVPFEQIESVIGLIVYDREAMLAAGHSPAADGAHPANPIGTEARDWLLQRVEDEEAELMLFNRYTGERLNG